MDIKTYITVVQVLEASSHNSAPNHNKSWLNNTIFYYVLSIIKFIRFNLTVNDGFPRDNRILAYWTTPKVAFLEARMIMSLAIFP